uniref:Uncharacterized protein n=1 Tax=Arundo donax TaxID=35708 RepID=A0A0A9AYD4_ARUDO
MSHALKLLSWVLENHIDTAQIKQSSWSLNVCLSGCLLNWNYLLVPTELCRFLCVCIMMCLQVTEP